LRPAIIARKVSCGNKTSAGARAQEIFMSLAAAARQRGESFFLLCQRAARLSPEDQRALEVRFDRMELRREENRP
jgi:hypothetical protein